MACKKNIDVALSLDPFSGETQASLGYWYFQNFDWHAAEITYKRSLKLNSNQSNVYLWLAILLEAKGENDEALSIYNKGNDINPMWDYLLQNKVRLLANMNNKEAAYAVQRSLITKATHDPVLLNKRYSDLSLLQWSFDDKEVAIASAKSKIVTAWPSCRLKYSSMPVRNPLAPTIVCIMRMTSDPFS